jgi:hypothetical protein
MLEHQVKPVDDHVLDLLCKGADQEMKSRLLMDEAKMSYGVTWDAPLCEVISSKTSSKGCKP